MKRDDRATDPATAGDFYRDRKPATSDPLVEFLTTYSRMIVSAEEIERQLLAAYGPDRLPGTESRRRSNMGLSPREPVLRTCAQCGEALAWTPRFCSQACWRVWHEEHQRPPVSAETLAEMKAEMLAARDEARAYIEDDE